MSPWKRFLRAWHHNRKDRLWCEFREWYAIHQQALALSLAKCPYCQFPIGREDAFFCSQCGASLRSSEEPTLQPGPYAAQQLRAPSNCFPGETEPMLPTTRASAYITQPLSSTSRPFDAYRRNQRARQGDGRTAAESPERPFDAYRRQFRQQQLDEIPTTKFRTVRLDRID